MFTNLSQRVPPLRALAAACATVVVAVAALVPFASPGSASAAAISAHGSQKARYCLVEIAKIHPPKPASRIIGWICSDRHEPGSALPVGAPKGGVILITFYKNRDYGHPKITVKGFDGPCDVVGYHFSDTTRFNAHVGGISSYKLHNNCHFASYWDQTGFTGHKKSAFPGDNPYVGDLWNDHLLSMRTWA